MSAHFVQVLQTIVTVLAIFAMIWKFRKDILTEVDKKFDAFKSDIDNRFESIDRRFESIDRRFESIDKRFESIDKRFESIDKRFDKIEAVLENIQQNHLDHITQLHVNPNIVPSTGNKEETPKKYR